MTLDFNNVTVQPTFSQPNLRPPGPLKTPPEFARAHQPPLTMVAMIGSGLFTILRRVRSSGNSRTPEQTYLSFLFSKIVGHIDGYRDELGPKWPAFADELRVRLDPIMSSPSELSAADLSNAADAIIDQFKACPDLSETVERLLKVVDDLLPNLSLPYDWRLKQDLLTNFHRLNDFLGKDEGDRELMADIRSDSGRSVGSSAGSSAGNSGASSSGGERGCPSRRSLVWKVWDGINIKCREGDNRYQEDVNTWEGLGGNVIVACSFDSRVQ